MRDNHMEPEEDDVFTEDDGPVQVNVLDIVEQLQAWSNIPRYSGSGEESFSSWVGRLEDAFTLQDPAPTEPQKCARFKFHLTGSARDYFEQADDRTRASFNLLKEAFQVRFESKSAKVTAKQKLANCMQKPNETVSAFAERFRQYVKAATVGEHEEVRKSRMLNDFIEKLRPKLKFHVRAADPTAFEEAFEAALKFESLLDEHDTDQFRTHANVNLVKAGESSQTDGLQARLESMEKVMSEMGGRIRKLALDANGGR
ncbi:DCT-10 protein, partial [Aphelenchoides avenae]